MAGSHYRVSSSLTLFFKIFFPTFWSVFFGSFLILILFFGEQLGYAFTRIEVKAGFVVVFAGFFFLMYFTVMRLKRIELTHESFYVTNYFRTYRYTFDSLADVRVTDFIVGKILTLEFNSKAAFGKKVFCILRGSVWESFLATHPEVFSHLLEEKDNPK